MGRTWIRSAIAVACGIAFGLVAATSSPPSAAAAVIPGKPLAVAPGVPSHGRAWELVTSPESTPSATLAEGVSVTPDGGALLYRNLGVLPGYPLGQVPVAMLSIRRPHGWNPMQPLPLHPELNNEVLNTPVAFGPGNETMIWSNALESHGSETALYLQDRSGAFTLLLERAGFLAASPDLQRLIVSGTGHFLPADATRTQGASIYERVGSTMRLLDVAGDGSLISDCGSVSQAVSTDLDRVYFTARPSCAGPARLYLAEAGSGTREVSRTRCTSACGEPAEIRLLASTPSGSSVLLRTAEKLTDEDVNSHLDLYRYDAAGDELTLISSGSGGPDLVPATYPEGQPFPAWESADGSRAYFYAAEQTGPETTGEPGVYLANASGTHLLVTAATTELIEISADGRYVLLNSTLPLQAGDTDGEKDVYRYDAVNDSFECISKGPVAGNGPFAAAAEKDLHLTYSGGALPGKSFRVMSEDASRIFFVTKESLVPEDANGLQDVYEWANGDVGLISSGAGKLGSTLLTATPDGYTVIFKTSETLVPRDRDGDDYDYYAARIGGGFDESASEAETCPCSRSAPARQSLDRSEAASAKGPGARIALRSPDARERRHFARSGWIELLVEAPSAGRLSAEARARLGGRMRTVASTAVAVAKPGSVQLRMRLSKVARSHLAGGGDLRIGIHLALAGNPGAGRTIGFELGGNR